MTITRQDLTVVLMDTWPFQITCNNDSGPINLTGGSARMRIFNDSGVLFDLYGTILTPTAGIVTFQVLPSVQTNVAPGIYEYAIKAYPLNQPEQTQAYGSFTIKQSPFARWPGGG